MMQVGHSPELLSLEDSILENEFALGSLCCRYCRRKLKGSQTFWRLELLPWNQNEQVLNSNNAKNEGRREEEKHNLSKKHSKIWKLKKILP